MWHHELGKSTADIWEEERLAKRAADQERAARLADIVTLLQNLHDVRHSNAKLVATWHNENGELLSEDEQKAASAGLESARIYSRRQHVADEQASARFGVRVTEADMNELQDRLHETTQAERTALEEMTNNPRVIGGTNE